MVVFHRKRVAKAVNVGIFYAINGKYPLNSLFRCFVIRNEEIGIGTFSTTAIIDWGVA